MIVLGLFGALSNYGYRWGWYGIGCLFQILIVLGLVLTGALTFIYHMLWGSSYVSLGDILLCSCWQSLEHGVPEYTAK